MNETTEEIVENEMEQQAQAEAVTAIAQQAQEAEAPADAAPESESEEAPDEDTDEAPVYREPPTYGRFIIVLGAGGIGGNFLRGFTAEEDFRVIAAIDDDKVELSNLNRIPLALSEIGISKVDMKKSILAGIDKRVCTTEEFLEYMAEVFNKPALKDNPELWAAFAYRNGIVVIDARDTSDPNVIFPEIDIKLTYDGGDACCIEFNPDYGKDSVIVTGTVAERTYSVTPSFVAPPTMLVYYAYRLLYAIPYTWYATIGRRMEKNIKHFFSLNDLFMAGCRGDALV